MDENTTATEITSIPDGMKIKARKQHSQILSYMEQKKSNHPPRRYICRCHSSTTEQMQESPEATKVQWSPRRNRASFANRQKETRLVSQSAQILTLLEPIGIKSEERPQPSEPKRGNQSTKACNDSYVRALQWLIERERKGKLKEKKTKEAAWMKMGAQLNGSML